LAVTAVNANTRDAYIHERDNWLEIAASIDAAEEALKQRKN
jgi:hypothetical protein